MSHNHPVEFVSANELTPIDEPKFNYVFNGVTLKNNYSPEELQWILAAADEYDFNHGRIVLKANSETQVLRP